MLPALLNHYVRHTRSGRHYKTKEAESFEEIGAYVCRAAQPVCAKSYSVTIDIYQGAGQKGDIDGYAKQVLDLLANNGLLLDRNGKLGTDAHVTELHMTKRRCKNGPRTEVTILGLL
jgi:Holliday junction resolvase RusA-like endonuclease